jgi:hypothetical protein
MLAGAKGNPTHDEVRAAIEGITASNTFRNSPHLTAFFRYIVETTLRGEGDHLKGYTIAVEALGRSDNFDPQTDPVVRVYAGRLRRALEQYYAGPGKMTTIIIDVPLGHYVPTFRYRRSDSRLQVLRATLGRRIVASVRAWRVGSQIF